MRTNSDEVLLILIISTSLILLLGAVVVIIVLIQNKRKYSHKQQLSEMQIHYEKTLLGTKVGILEETYSAISKNLHDNIGSNISTAMLLLYKDGNMTLSEQDTNRIEAIAILDKVVDDLKNIARSLNPDYLLQVGVSEAIQQRVAQLRKAKKFNLELLIDQLPYQLDKRQQVFLFYIFQEAINNINSHAEAKNISVHLLYNNDQLQLRIKDDGVGMELRSDSTKGAGLVNIKNYAETIGARFEIISEPGKGTDLKISLPQVLVSHESPILGIDTAKQRS
jgi:two-component system, NarL family, sensor kinase